MESWLQWRCQVSEDKVYFNVGAGKGEEGMGGEGGGGGGESVLTDISG